MGDGGLTAEKLRAMTFEKPGWPKRGYEEQQVDAVLFEIASAIALLGTGAGRVV